MRTLAVSLILSLAFISHARAAETLAPPLAPYAVLGSDNDVFLQGPNGRVLARNAKNGRVLWKSDVAGEPIGLVGSELIVAGPLEDDGQRFVAISSKDGAKLRASDALPYFKRGPGESLSAFARRDGEVLVVAYELGTSRAGGREKAASPATHGVLRLAWPSLKEASHRQGTADEASPFKGPASDSPGHKLLEVKSTPEGDVLWRRKSGGRAAVRLSSAPTSSWFVTGDDGHVGVISGKNGKALTLYSLETGKKVGEIDYTQGQVTVIGGRAWVAFDKTSSKIRTPTVEVRNLPSGKRIWSHRSKAQRIPKERR